MLSQGLSGTGKCCDDPEKEDESGGVSGNHAGTKGRNLFHLTDKKCLLYDQGYIGYLDGEDSQIASGKGEEPEIREVSV